MRTPREVFGLLLGGIEDGRWAELGELYADDAVVEQPMAPAGSGLGRIEGRERVAAHFAAAATMPLRLTARNVRVHETADPEVIVAEFDYEVHATGSGRRSHAANVQVLRVRDGKIVASRDYHDHPVLAAALA